MMRSTPIRIGLSPAALSAAVALALAPPAGGQEWRTDFGRHTVPLDEIVSGGPPKDGIPAIDRPRFQAAERVAWLDDRDPVVAVTVDGVVHAYPLAILIWHEIVNDVVNGRPVVVTYCPLCNTALAFDRRLDGRVLDFGTTGRLRHSDLVMYDRQTESWWQQATGEGIVGAYAGRRLSFIPAPTMSWRTVRTTYPSVRVLSRETGFARDYGRNPYVGYDGRRAPLPGFHRGSVDARLPAMERVVALVEADPPVAYPFSVLRAERVLNRDVGDVPSVVLWAPGTASALDAAAISRGRDVGATGVFDRRVDGRVLRFTPADSGAMRDVETGSEWTLAGRAVRAPLTGRRLEPVVHGNHLWFAWVAFRPDTKVAR